MANSDFILSIGGADQLPPTPGCELWPCFGCGQLIWVHPQSEPLLEQGVPLFCVRCAPDLSVGPTLTEEQRLVIERALGRPYSWEEYRFASAILVVRARSLRGGRDTAPTPKEVP